MLTARATEPDGSGRPPAGEAAGPPTRAPSIVVGAVTVLAVAVGVALRLWFLAHETLTSDEAVAGLMADGILHGHFYVFYWGQDYGGVEPYAVAAMFAVFGHSGEVIRITAAILAAVSAVVAWRVALRLVDDRRVAVLAAVLTWVAPEVYVYASAYEYGFRGVTLLAGLTALLFALRLLDRRNGRQGGSAVVDAAALGLAAGIGWWASPEVIYFLFPAGLLLVGALVDHRAVWSWLRSWALRLAVLVVAFVIGALPWLYDNVRSGFASLTSSSFDANPPLDYRQRLHVFFHRAGPIEVNLRVAHTGKRLVGGPGGPGWERLGMDAFTALVAVALVATFVLCLVRRGRAVAVAAAVVAFPFLYAASPATWYWEDGRYVTYLGPLLALMLAVGIDEVGRLRRRSREPNAPRHRRRIEVRGSLAAGAMAVVVLVAGATTVVAFRHVYGVSDTTFTQHWRDTDAPLERSLATLESHGVTHGYGDYWVAYDADFFGQGHVAFSTLDQLDRSASIARAASLGHRQAWLFEAPYGGPDDIPQATFVDALIARRIPFRIVRAGPITAVQPSVPVSAAEGLKISGV